MTQDNPSKRPTMAEVVERFAKIRSKLWWWKLRARLVRRSEFRVVEGCYDILFHVFWTVPQLVSCRPAIPRELSLSGTMY